MLRERCQRTGGSRRWFPSGAQYGSTCMCVIHSLNGCPDSLRMGCASCFWWGGCGKTRCAGGTCRSEHRKPSARSWGLCGISSWLAALAARLVETLTLFASRTAQIGPAQTPRPTLALSIRQDPPRTATADGHRPPQPIRSFTLFTRSSTVRAVVITGSFV